MIKAGISDDATLAGAPARLTRIGQTGHVVFGPYRRLTHGVYQVDFTLALADAGRAGSDPCVTLDVSADHGNRLLVERAVRTVELSAEPRAFGLLFVLRTIECMEFRVEAHGNARVVVGAEPRLVRVSGVLDEPQDGIARFAGDAPALARDTCRILRHLSPERLAEVGKVRLGNPADGGYVCPDDFAGLDTAFSFGINDDISWDRDAADRGLHVLQFDHTVADPAPDDPRTTFRALRVGGDGVSLADLIREHDRGAPKPNLVLKMDIEEAEWDVIDDTPPELLARLAWIVCEMHYFQGLARASHRDRIDRCLAKLGALFAPVHVHANVWGGISSLANVVFPDVLEVSFANRAVYRTAPGDELFPSALDRSCDPDQPDFHLGAFRF